MTTNKYAPEGTLIATAENREYISSVYGLERARLEEKILEGVVDKCDNETYTLHVDLNGIDGIIRREECVFGENPKDIAIITRVGKSVAFKVMQIIKEEGKKPVAILSRKEAQRECVNNYLMDLIPGDIIPAKITHFENFGAFVDIGCGVNSLICIDSVSVSRISSPTERFKMREELSVVVKSIDYDTGRIYVSTRELFGTWEENASMFSQGQTVSGIIRSIESYGIFVELSPNLAGLAELKEGVEVGQSCAVYIKNIMPEKMKIKLVIIDSYNSKLTTHQPKYFIDTDKVKHLDYWRYSPKNCDKLIETVF
ncbi:MAG: 30S ribosomal protein S1 [Clostridia bacterium]|nr:30S ribosomal protein S1 [Clostridia bacterium]